MTNSKAIALTELPPGISARVENILTEPDAQKFLQRLVAMGLSRDRPIEVLRQAGFGGPLHIRVGQTTELAIRRKAAQLIKVVVIDNQSEKDIDC